MKPFNFYRASLAAILLFLSGSTALAAGNIEYRVKLLPEARQLEITVKVSHVTEPTAQFQIPTWSPGAYMVSNFASNISDVSATVDGKTASVSHPDKLTWEVETKGSKQVEITYHVGNADIESREGQFKRAHISGPRTYMYLVGHKQEPAQVTIIKPAESMNAICSLDSISDSKHDSDADARIRVAYAASSYDVLADAPIEMGDFADDVFTVNGVEHHVVLYGSYANADRVKLKDYCKRVAETEEAFFNDVPFHRYVFMFRSTGGNQGGAGGLEHLGSTEIGMRGLVEDRLRSVIAHEFFHLWNVKRIRPFVLGPFDYVNPPHTSNLWWSEGVTSYYGDLLSRRGGINTDSEYLKHLGDTIGLLQNNANRLKVTADESSFKVWDRGGSQGFGGLSYYTKGELIGLCLDLMIRHETQNRKSLDDVIRSLYAQCRKGNGPGFAEDDIKKTVNHVSGKDLSAFYDKLARSTEEMPFAECLGYAGLNLRQASESEVSADLGMTAGPDREGKGYRVRFVFTEGAAVTAGIKDDDLITAIDGTPVKNPSGRLFAESKPGEKHTLTIDRAGAQLEIAYTVGASKRKPWFVESNPTASAETIKIRESWLSGSKQALR